MSKLKTQRAEIKNIGGSTRQQKKYAPAVRAWDNRQRDALNNSVTKMCKVFEETKHLI